MSHAAALDTIMTISPVIPVVTLNKAEDGVPLARALVAGGVKIIEITLRTEAGVEAIRRVAKEVPEICVGAGTITSREQFTAAVDAGSQFIVSPGLTDKLAQALVGQKTPLLPGVATTTEIMHAMEYGYTRLKFFPASLSGGHGALKQFSGLFPEIAFCPTGGINLQNVKDYLAVPNVRCIGGSWIAPDGLIHAQDWAGITRLCTEALTLTQK